MTYRSDEPTLRSLWWFFVLLVVALSVIAGVTRVTGLLYFPWEVEMRTQMLRNTNAYVTTQIGALRQLSVSFEDPRATPAQRAAIRMQMQNLIDQLPPHEVPADIRSLMNR